MTRMSDDAHTNNRFDHAGSHSSTSGNDNNDDDDDDNDESNDAAKYTTLERMGTS